MRHSFTLIELLTVTRLRPSGYERASRHRGSFTLIELLVVIAIVAILSAVVIITLNPAELLRQSRDSNRLSDLASLNKALGIFEADVVGGSMGSSSTVYVSLPDTSSTCANLGLPTLPAGYTYACVTEANLRKTDGTGWLPVDLGQISSKSPLGSLPTDPVNTTSTGLFYYTYTPGGSWELTSLFESNKYVSKATTDGGFDPAMYESGSNLSLSPFAHGMAGSWKFDEGSGATATDASGWGNTGTLNNGPSWLTSESCKAESCLSFDGTNDYVRVPASASVDSYPGAKTYSLWIYNGNSSNYAVLNHQWGGTPGAHVIFPNYWAYMYFDGPTPAGCATPSVVGTWYHLALVVNRVTGGAAYISLYVDGELSCTAGTGLSVSLVPAADLDFGAQVNVGNYFTGRVDDVKMYNRALSAAEIAAIYNATK